MMLDYYFPADQDSGTEGEDDMDRAFLHFYDQKVLSATKRQGDLDHVPISGNIYMYWAISGFGDSSKLFQEKADWIMKAGSMVTIVVQVTGPVILLWWAAKQMTFHVGDVQKYFELLPSFAAERCLGLMFLVLFTVNGLYTLRSDRKETEKMVHMCRVFERAAEKYDEYEPPDESWLWVGAAVNSWCLVLCSVCMLLMFLLSETDEMGIKDIIFDAFAITFLYNLDDPVGDLSFLDEKWDEDLMGDIYGLLADNLPIIEEIKVEREGRCSPDNIYELGESVQYVLIVVLPLIYIIIEPAGPLA